MQDFPSLEAQFESVRPADLVKRVSFQGHDFFQEQPVKGADVYFLRRVLHDWPDKYAEKILRAVLPAMEAQSRIVVNDFVFPSRGQLPWMVERMLTTIDLQMMVALNSRERSVEEWTQIFKASDERFQLKSAQVMPGTGGSMEVVMEFVLRTE